MSDKAATLSGACIPSAWKVWWLGYEDNRVPMCIAIVASNEIAHWFRQSLEADERNKDHQFLVTSGDTVGLTIEVDEP
jgi:hypothetical protein